MWSAQAAAEGLVLRVADNKAGYFGVTHQSGKTKPYLARVKRDGRDVNLGCFATAEEAALSVARSPEGQAAAQRAAAVLTSEEVRQQAQAEGLTLRVADNKTGYLGVYHKPGYPKPFQAQVWRGCKMVNLGTFATAEEAALSVARSPEGQTAAQRAAAATRQRAAVAPLVSEAEGKGAMPSGATLKEEGAVPPMPHGAFVKEENMPSNPVVKEEGVVPPMPPGAFVKTEAVVKEEERSDGRSKWQRTK